jgi:rsbT co-antagonist protein RsbR
MVSSFLDSILDSIAGFEDMSITATMRCPARQVNAGLRGAIRMTTPRQTAFAGLLRQHEAAILTAWLERQGAAGSRQPEQQREQRSRQFLSLFSEAVQRAPSTNIQIEAWAGVRELLAEFSRERARLGFSPAETATFLFSLKEPLFARLRAELQGEALATETWSVSTLLDALGLFTIELYQKDREEVIARQQQDLLELSTPVVELWDGILALPLIGTLDSARTQVVMENLLQRIVDTGGDIAIIDITGVPTVDTLVAQHLLKTVAAARLMGAECIISGIRPQIAQTIVHLGVELGSVTTKATLADAFGVALKNLGLAVTRATSS